jgi:hypothetical protein
VRLPAGHLPWCVPSHSCFQLPVPRQPRRKRVLCKAHDLLRMPVDVYQLPMDMHWKTVCAL